MGDVVLNAMLNSTWDDLSYDSRGVVHRVQRGAIRRLRRDVWVLVIGLVTTNCMWIAMWVSR